MFKKIAIIAFVSVLIACNVEEKSVFIETGTLQGKVIWLEGNVMPGIGIGIPEEKPIQRDVYIMPAAKANDLNVISPIFYQTTFEDYQIVTTDENGEFTVSLPVGHYSVLVDEGEHGLFANTADGDGYLNSVFITAGETTTMTIQVDYEAYH